ncbi:hypothetical protein KHP62_05415 [Rhodobacteraceae bacterium NNCM2]|nr:hypothetical protein [Coraliihabitans acroporae]
MRQRIEENAELTRLVREEERNPNFSAILPVKGRFSLRRQPLFTKLRELLGEDGPEIAIDPIDALTGEMARSWISLRRPRPETILFTIGDIRMLVSHEHSRFEDADGVYSFCNPGLWAAGVADVADHSSITTVLELSDTPFPHPDDVYDRAVAVTVTAAAVAALHPVKAVLWQPARNALPPTLFDATVEDLCTGAPPLMLWTRWSLLAADRDGLHPGIVTRGLEPFIQREIIAPPSTVPKERMLEAVFRLASRMLNWETKPKEGEIIDGATPCKLRYRRKSIYSSAPYFEICPIEQGADADAATG